MKGKGHELSKAAERTQRMDARANVKATRALLKHARSAKREALAIARDQIRAARKALPLKIAHWREVNRQILQRAIAGERHAAQAERVELRTGTRGRAAQLIAAANAEIDKDLKHLRWLGHRRHKPASSARVAAALRTAEKRSESDDFVKAELPEEMHAAWEENKHKIRPKKHTPRWEVALEYFGEHSELVSEANARKMDRGIARELRGEEQAWLDANEGTPEAKAYLAQRDKAQGVEGYTARHLKKTPKAKAFSATSASYERAKRNANRGTGATPKRAAQTARTNKPKTARTPIDPEVRTSRLTARQTGKIPGQPDVAHDVTTKHLRGIEAAAMSWPEGRASALFDSLPDRADPTKHKALREAARAEARARHDSPADWPIWMPGDPPQGAAPTRTVLDVIEHSQARQRGRLARDAQLDAMAQREDERMGRKYRAERKREEAAAKKTAQTTAWLAKHELREARKAGTKPKRTIADPSGRPTPPGPTLAQRVKAEISWIVPYPSPTIQQRIQDAVASANHKLIGEMQAQQPPAKNDQTQHLMNGAWVELVKLAKAQKGKRAKPTKAKRETVPKSVIEARAAYKASGSTAEADQNARDKAIAAAIAVLNVPKSQRVEIEQLVGSGMVDELVEMLNDYFSAASYAPTSDEQFKQQSVAWDKLVRWAKYFEALPPSAR